MEHFNFQSTVNRPFITTALQVSSSGWMRQRGGCKCMKLTVMDSQ